MPNIKITDLPTAILPMDLTQTFFEVQTFEAGIPVSRKASGNELTFTTDDVIKGTSSDDPADPGGNFDGTQTWRNFLNQQTASVGFNPTGDDFIIQNFAQGGNISLRVRDGTERLLTQDYGVTIPTTGAIRVPVGTTGEEPSPVDGQIRYDSSTNRFRGVVNGSWEDLASGDAISDVDGDTQIQVEETADEDIIRFDLGDNVTGFPAQPNALIFSSGQFTLALPTADVVATAGGAISITSGAGNTTGDGGNYLLNTGDGGASGDAGDIRLKAGDGGASAGDGGCIWIEAGEDTGGVGTTGNVFINTQTGAGAQAGSVITTGIPGLVAIYGVNVTGNLQAGNVDVWGGYSFGSGGGSVGGHVQIFGGGAGGGGETGGDVRLFGGEGDNFGGRVEILGGDVTTTGAGADVFITGGESPNTTPGGVVIEGRDATAVNSAGGRVEITGGNSGATSGVGGPITLTAGFGFGGGGLLTLKGGSGNDQSDGGAVDLLSGGGGGGGGSPGAGGIITILGGESRGITDGPAINITAGLAVSTGDGGAVNIIGGLAGAAGGVGGAVVLTGGAARQAAETGGGVSILTGDGGAAAAPGGDFVVEVGTGAGTGASGNFFINTITGVGFQGGSVSSSQDPGLVAIYGVGFTGNGKAGNVEIWGGYASGSSPSAIGGDLMLFGGGAGGSNAVGGDAMLMGGDAEQTPGCAQLIGGTATVGGNGGHADVIAGPGIGGNSLGGLATITGGDAAGTGRGGHVDITGGANGPSDGGNSGGNVTLTGGPSAATNGDGGDIVLTPGAGTGSGFDGAIEIPQTTAPQSATDRLYNIAGALTWNGIDLTVSVVALNDLSDVIITGPGNGDTFFFDGSDWVNTDRIIFTAGTEPQISFFDGTAGFGSVSMNDPNEISIKSGVSLNFKSTSAGAEIYGGGVIRLNFRSNSQEQSTFFAPVGAGNDALIRLEDGDVEYGHILKEGSGEFTIRNDEAGASLQLQVRNVADTVYETGIVIVSDADVQLFFNNIEMAHTVIVGSGGFEVNNTVTGGGFERVLTTADLGGVADPLTLGQIILTDTTGLDLVDNDNAFNIGTLAGQHLAFDTSNVQSKSSASTTGTLRLNVLGGNIVIGNSTFRVDMEGTAPVALDNNTNALNLGSPGAAHLAFGPAQIQAKNTGTAAAAISINSLGGNLSIGAQSGTGTVLLYDDGNLVAQTTDSGFDVLAALFDIDNSGSTAATGLRARNSEGGFEIRVDGDDTEFFQTASNAAQEDLLLKFFNDGRTEFFFNGIIEADTQLHNTDYQTSGMRVKNHQGDMVDVGFNLMPVIELDTNTTLNETHVSQMLHRDNTGAVLYTLPSGTTGAIPPVGALIMVTNENATGAHTITAAGTLRWLEGTGTPTTGTRTLAEGGVASCYHYSDTEWWIWGIGIS